MQFNPSNGSFGFMRVTDKIDNSVTVSACVDRLSFFSFCFDNGLPTLLSQIKFVYLRYQPKDLPPMKKAEISTRIGLINKVSGLAPQRKCASAFPHFFLLGQVFTPFHVDFFIESAQEINDDAVATKVQKLRPVWCMECCSCPSTHTQRSQHNLPFFALF